MYPGTFNQHACNCWAAQRQRNEKKECFNYFYDLTTDTPIFQDNQNNQLDSHVIKSQSDKQSYRAFCLPNKMKILLIHDPETDKAAAALSVLAGSMQDPESLPGLAHLCEHMLFLGTQKYPLENSFQKYLASHGGDNNAFTQRDLTNFYFDVSPDGFDGALDRFAQFFIAPLFTESAIEREINAVNSEHKKNVPDDTERRRQVEAFLTQSSHDYRKFDCGNRLTLWTRPQEESMNLHEQLIKFYTTNYSANLMSLVVLSKESCDFSQRQVEKYFSSIKNLNSPIPTWPSPYGQEEVMTRIDLVPVMDITNLQLLFPLPDYTEEFKTGIVTYLGFLLDQEGPGSLLSKLKHERWTTSGLDAVYERIGKGFATFMIDIDLTQNGLENVDEVVTCFFQYIQMLKQHGPQRSIWEEIKTIGENNFKYLEKESSFNYVQNLATLMSKFPTRNVISSKYLISDYNPKLIKDMINLITPTNMRMIISARSNTEIADQVEEYYGAKFKYSKINLQLIQKWRNPPPRNFTLPSSNQFLPTQFDLKPRDPKSCGNTPRIIEQNDLSRVWFLQDNEFNLPMATIILAILSPLGRQQAKYYNLSCLMTRVVQDCVSQFTAEAANVGFNYELESSIGGLTLSVTGYNEKVGILFNRILDTLVHLNSVGSRYSDILEDYKKDLKNWQDEVPYVQVLDYTSDLLRNFSWSTKQLENAMKENVYSSSDLLKFSRNFFSRVKLEWFFHGNLTECEALQTFKMGSKNFEQIFTKCVHPSEIASSREAILPTGITHIYRKEHLTHTNSCVLVFFQSGVDSMHESVILDVIENILNEPAYDTLRTKEQLGYVVLSDVRKIKGTLGLRIIVQGEKRTAFLDQRIDSFLQNIAENLENLTEQQFLEARKAVAVIKAEKPKTLWDRGVQIFEEIIRETFNFEKQCFELKELETLKLEEIKHFFEEWISPRAPKRKKLLIQIEAQLKDDDNAPTPSPIRQPEAPKIQKMAPTTVDSTTQKMMEKSIDGTTITRKSVHEFITKLTNPLEKSTKLTSTKEPKDGATLTEKKPLKTSLLTALFPDSMNKKPIKKPRDQEKHPKPAKVDCEKSPGSTLGKKKVLEKKKSDTSRQVIKVSDNLGIIEKSANNSSLLGSLAEILTKKKKYDSLSAFSNDSNDKMIQDNQQFILSNEYHQTNSQKNIKEPKRVGKYSKKDKKITKELPSKKQEGVPVPANETIVPEITIDSVDQEPIKNKPVLSNENYQIHDQVFLYNIPQEKEDQKSTLRLEKESRIAQGFILPSESQSKIILQGPSTVPSSIPKDQDRPFSLSNEYDTNYHKEVPSIDQESKSERQFQNIDGPFTLANEFDVVDLDPINQEPEEIDPTNRPFVLTNEYDEKINEPRVVSEIMKLKKPELEMKIQMANSNENGADSVQLLVNSEWSQSSERSTTQDMNSILSDPDPAFGQDPQNPARQVTRDPSQISVAGSSKNKRNGKKKNSGHKLHQKLSRSSINAHDQSRNYVKQSSHHSKSHSHKGPKLRESDTVMKSWMTELITKAIEISRKSSLLQAMHETEEVDDTILKEWVYNLVTKEVGHSENQTKKKLSPQQEDTVNTAIFDAIKETLVPKKPPKKLNRDTSHSDTKDEYYVKETLVNIKLKKNLKSRHQSPTDSENSSHHKSHSRRKRRKRKPKKVDSKTSHDQNNSHGKNSRPKELNSQTNESEDELSPIENLEGNRLFRSSDENLDHQTNKYAPTGRGVSPKSNDVNRLVPKSSGKFDPEKINNSGNVREVSPRSNEHNRRVIPNLSNENFDQNNKISSKLSPKVGERASRLNQNDEEVVPKSSKNFDPTGFDPTQTSKSHYPNHGLVPRSHDNDGGVPTNSRSNESRNKSPNQAGGKGGQLIENGGYGTRPFVGNGPPRDNIRDYRPGPIENGGKSTLGSSLRRSPRQNNGIGISRSDNNFDATKTRNSSRENVSKSVLPNTKHVFGASTDGVSKSMIPNTKYTPSASSTIRDPMIPFKSQWSRNNLTEAKSGTSTNTGKMFPNKLKDSGSNPPPLSNQNSVTQTAVVETTAVETNAGTDQIPNRNNFVTQTFVNDVDGDLPTDEEDEEEDNQESEFDNGRVNIIKDVEAWKKTLEFYPLPAPFMIPVWCQDKKEEETPLPPVTDQGQGSCQCQCHCHQQEVCWDTQVPQASASFTICPRLCQRYLYHCHE